MAYQDSNLRQELLITTSLLRHDIVYIVYSSAHDLLYPNKPRSCERIVFHLYRPCPFLILPTVPFYRHWAQN